MADFLLEIGTEEIPPGVVYGLAAEFGRRVSKALEDNFLVSKPEEPIFDFPVAPVTQLTGGMKLFAAPRRIGFIVRGLPSKQEDRRETVLGPPWKIAVDENGNWTKAASGFAAKNHVDPSLLKKKKGPKGAVAGFARDVPGKPTDEILSVIVPKAVDSLYLPKTMRWGAGEYNFVRPVRWIVALLDKAVVPMTIKGIESGRVSRGHRIHGEQAVEIPSVDEYRKRLLEQYVIVDPKERKDKIERELEALSSIANGEYDSSSSIEEIQTHRDLIDTLVFSCQYPTVLLGEFPDRYTDLPSPILVTCLKEHQKSFALHEKGSGKQLSGFCFIMDGPGDAKGLIRSGNENAAASRLADARFFYENDLKVPLEKRLEELKGIVFHPKLGTYFDKAKRMEALVMKLAPYLGVSEESAGEAALLAKADLASLLIQEKEFVGLQGIAGGLYAKAQGRKPEIALAIGYQYEVLPPPPSELPASQNPSDLYLYGAVGLADRLDTLFRFFSIGIIPTGSKDPFALRRAAGEIVEILLGPCRAGKDLPFFDLGEFIAENAPGCADAVIQFITERLRYRWEREAAGSAGETYPYDEVDAVLSGGRLTDLREMRARLEALHSVRQRLPEDFDALSVAFKRSKNILKGFSGHVLDPALFLPESDREGAGERALYSAYIEIRDEVERFVEESGWEKALTTLASIRPVVDHFFDDVLVMCDPEGKDSRRTLLQRNRLALLQSLVSLFERVADFSRIVPAGV